MVKETETLAKQFQIRPRTIFLGGGTPSALSSNHLKSLLQGFKKALDLSELEEFTLEANPGSVSARKAALLRQLGVTRISLGVQSWDDQLLKLLGREHNSQQADESFRLLRAAGFDNLNIDLMFGLPGQTRDQWQDTLDRTVALQPEHISAYCLTYEEDTEFFLRHSRGEFRSDSDVETDFFERGMNTLEAAGYDHYEISNYARPGFASVHNHAYWLGNDYIGIGPSAFSTIGAKRWQNVADYRRYADAVLAGESPIASIEDLTPDMKRLERLALGLRTREGVSADVLDGWPEQTAELLELGLLTRSNGSYLLTRAGRSMADSVAAAYV